MTKHEAQEAYRQAWTGWCLALDSEAKKVFETRMDSLQSSITERPGPEWAAFIKTLPGYQEFWDGWLLSVKENLKKPLASL